MSWQLPCSRAPVLAALLAFAGLTNVVCAQQQGEEPEGEVVPVAARVTDQPETEPAIDPPVEPIPELPETVVPGRIGNFPAEPLGDDTVISPNRVTSPANQSASSLTVITQEQIQRSGQNSVAEVLRGTLGVDVVRQGGPGSITNVFLRGANSQQTKVLLDGIPLNDPSSASRAFDFSNLTVDNIERIEVLRGPQSMVYGSDAIGGVVNIITKRGQGPLSIRATGMGGSFNTAQTGVNVSGGDARRYYSVSGSFLSTGGISAASVRNGNHEHDSYNNGTASGRFGYNLGDTWNADYVFRYIDAAAEVDDFDFFTGLPVDNLIRKNLTKNFSNRFQLTNWALEGQVQQKVGFSLNDYDRRDTDAGFFGVPTFHGQTREVDYQAVAQLTPTNVLSGGANYQDEESTTGGLFGSPPFSQNIQGVYLQDALQIGPNWFSTAGVRWDDTSRYGDAQTYRVTSLYNILGSGSALHGSIGTGFRQPAIVEQQFSAGNLRPERSKGWDVGFRQQVWGDVIVADATYFRNDFRDLLLFSPATFFVENIGSARSSGVELTLQCYLTEQSWINASYTYDETLNNDTGNLLFRRPRNKATVSYTQLSFDQRASTTISMLCVGDRLDTGNRVLDQYVLLNMSGSFQATQHLRLDARLDNVTNTFYEEVRGYGVPGFGAYGGLNLIW